MSLDEIRDRVEVAPRLLVAKATDWNDASVYEEEDGLETIANIPNYYSDEVQNLIAEGIVAAYEDRAKLLAALEVAMGYGNEYTQRDLRESVDEVIANWEPRQY